MSRYDYHVSQQIAANDPPFYALIMALYRQADTENAAKIRKAWPETVAELEVRYHASGGYLPGENAEATS